MAFLEGAAGRGLCTGLLCHPCLLLVLHSDGQDTGAGTTNTHLPQLHSWQGGGGVELVFSASASPAARPQHLNCWGQIFSLRGWFKCPLAHATEIVKCLSHCSKEDGRRLSSLPSWFSKRLLRAHVVGGGLVAAWCGHVRVPAQTPLDSPPAGLTAPHPSCGSQARALPCLLCLLGPVGPVELRSPPVPGLCWNHPDINERVYWFWLETDEKALKGFAIIKNQLCWLQVPFGTQLQW